MEVPLDATSFIDYMSNHSIRYDFNNLQHRHVRGGIFKLAGSCDLSRPVGSTSTERIAVVAFVEPLPQPQTIQSRPTPPPSSQTQLLPSNASQLSPLSTSGPRRSELNLPAAAAAGAAAGSNSGASVTGGPPSTQPQVPASVASGAGGSAIAPPHHVRRNSLVSEVSGLTQLSMLSAASTPPRGSMPQLAAGATSGGSHGGAQTQQLMLRVQVFAVHAGGGQAREAARAAFERISSAAGRAAHTARRSVGSHAAAARARPTISRSCVHSRCGSH